jgi:hypothetical protein
VGYSGGTRFGFFSEAVQYAEVRRASLKSTLAFILMGAWIVAILGLLKPLINVAFDADYVVAPAEIAEIRIDARSGWSLRIFRDGSARFGFGPNAFDWVAVPSGTYDFPAVYRKLRRIARLDGNSREFEAICFRGVGSSVACAQYSKNGSALRPLFESAMLHGTPFPGNRLGELWKSRPPF